MNSWSRSRKRIILSVVIFLTIGLIGVPAYFFFYQAPTCGDGKLNGDETGVDCGGSCHLLCSAESLPIISKGDPQVLTVATTTATSTYEVIALFDNPNPQARIKRAHYTLKVYSALNLIPVKTIEGDTFVPRGSKFAIFAGPFNLDANLLPTRTTLEWSKNTLIWEKDVNKIPDIVVTDQTLSNENSAPRLEANIVNNSLNDVSNIDLTAVLTDENGNTFAASRTYIDDLAANVSKPVIFTWPRAFSAKAAQIDIITRILPDSSYIK